MTSKINNNFLNVRFIRLFSVINRAIPIFTNSTHFPVQNLLQMIFLTINTTVCNNFVFKIENTQKKTRKQNIFDGWYTGNIVWLQYLIYLINTRSLKFVLVGKKNNMLYGFNFGSIVTNFFYIFKR